MKNIKENITPKNLWTTLVWGSLLAFLWVLSGFTVNYFIYLKQANHSIAEVFDWGVIEMDEDKFVICADFRFHTDGIDEYVSQHLFEKTPFPTMEIAEAAISTMKKKEWNCYWFGNPQDPQVSMNRDFPTKDLIYSLLALGVTVYFAFLKRSYLGDSEKRTVL
ncbi:MAG: hypothetical protein SP4CHLAM5_04110 [Chlamydiia bacterium]|nr:hypothetical protein [Chlamydiia bacterium]MCH9618284.1 hypothetical protein [Chlamydiia bacterium]MCH9624157.1 hypothetical protein [Chlamydiia bacterium]